MRCWPIETRKPGCANETKHILVSSGHSACTGMTVTAKLMKTHFDNQKYFKSVPPPLVKAKIEARKYLQCLFVFSFIFGIKNHV